MQMAKAEQTGGRSKSVELTERVLNAAEELLRKDGFAGLKVEQVAAIVGCGKTAIYRRWATKEELVAAVLLKDTEVGELPNSGSLAEDLLIHMKQGASYRGFTQPDGEGRSIWAALVEPAVRRLVDDALLSERRANGRTILARAIQRGEIPPETDLDAVLDMLGGFVFYRTMARREKLTEEVMARVARAVAASPPLYPNA
ncbi:TetR/AcrR family transcriptional regulator [Nonomuraea antimicrobica]|uniref:TetR/AcrR family transcriptional regulator n=2 Tax=Nonomuraea antimicrobica TaxID=561173 RepID=A0ABP7CB77_9ACTN